MKIKITAKNLLIALFAILTVWIFISTTGQSPDIILFKGFGWMFGINYTNNTALKIIAIGGWLLVIMISYIVDESKSEENV